MQGKNYMDKIDSLDVNRGEGLDSAELKFRKWFIWWALEKNSFNQSKTAKELGIHRNSLVRLIGSWGWTGKVRDGYRGLSPELGS